MATKLGIQQFLATLQAAGLMTERKGAPPSKTAVQRESIAAFWFALLGGVSDSQLQAGLAGFLCNPECCQWYPQPGTILQHAPGVKLPPTTSFGRQMAELERRIDEEERAHGISQDGSEGDPATPGQRLLQ